jgi:hypothetical protein
MTFEREEKKLLSEIELLRSRINYEYINGSLGFKNNEFTSKL